MPESVGDARAADERARQGRDLAPVEVVDEAAGDTGQYGLNRLTQLLPAYAGAPAQIICDAVEQDVVEYLGGRPHDDIALLAVTCGT